MIISIEEDCTIGLGLVQTAIVPQGTQWREDGEKAAAGIGTFQTRALMHGLKEGRGLCAVHFVSL